MKQTASMDFFTVPTATFRVLFVFIVLSHDRRRVLHFNVTDHPSEEWTGSKNPRSPQVGDPGGRQWFNAVA